MLGLFRYFLFASASRATIRLIGLTVSLSFTSYLANLLENTKIIPIEAVIVRRRELLAQYRHGERRGMKFEKIDDMLYEKIKTEVSKTRASQSNFFTRENIKEGSVHYVGKWWKYARASDQEKKCTHGAIKECSVFEGEAWKNLPSIKPGSWGKCAVVGFGDNLLRKLRGTEIDAHETVVRLAMIPLTPYKLAAGEKNTYVWIRDRKLRKFKFTFLNEDMYGFLASDLKTHQLPKALIYNSYRANMTGGWPTLSFGGYLNSGVDNLLQTILRMAVPSASTPDPTSGLLMTFTLLFSGYCSSVSVYGISTTMGARYWDGKSWDRKKKRLMKGGAKHSHLASNHNTLVESRILQAMEKMTSELQMPSLKFFE